MKVGSQSQTYGASSQVFNKRQFHGDKSKHRGDFSEVYSKSSSIHFWGKKMQFQFSWILSQKDKRKL